jgi:hypothetical protein
MRVVGPLVFDDLELPGLSPEVRHDEEMLPGGPYRYAPPITYGAVLDCVIRGALPPSLTMKVPMSGSAGSPGNGVFESSPPDRRFDVSRSSVHVPPSATVK